MPTTKHSGLVKHESSPWSQDFRTTLGGTFHMQSGSSEEINVITIADRHIENGNGEKVTFHGKVNRDTKSITYKELLMSFQICQRPKGFGTAKSDQ